MAATGYTPISLYYSSTTTNAPLAANLTNGELAINIADGKLFYKDSGGVVQVIATKDTTNGTFTNVTVSNNLTLSGGTANAVVYLNGSKVATTGSALTFDGTTLGTTTVDATNLEVTNVKAIDGTASATIANTTGYWTFSGTGAVTVPKGTTGQQPGSPVTGMLRYNTSNNQFEGYSGGTPAWNPVGGASLSNDTSTASNLYPTFANATSGTATTIYTSNANLLYKPSTGEFQSTALVASNGIVVNSNTVASNYTIASGQNAMSAGPITVNSGITVTVTSGSRWVVV